jgi:threonyl-tRNA synthetase
VVTLISGILFFFSNSLFFRFYYDFYIPSENQLLTSTDFKKIKKEMDRIISKNLSITREEVSPEEAKFAFSLFSFSLFIHCFSLTL